MTAPEPSRTPEPRPAPDQKPPHPAGWKNSRRIQQTEDAVALFAMLAGFIVSVLIFASISLGLLLVDYWLNRRDRNRLS